jgi:hypothetical protein
MGIRNYLSEEERNAKRRYLGDAELHAPIDNAKIDNSAIANTNNDNTAGSNEPKPVVGISGQMLRNVSATSPADARGRSDSDTIGLSATQIRELTTTTYEHSPLYEMSTLCQHHLDTMLPDHLDKLDITDRNAAMHALARKSSYEVGKFLAKGAESLLYTGQYKGYVFCVKAVRNWLSKWLGKSGSRANQGKLANVSYKTKVRHITNEYNVGRVLNEDNAFSQCPVRIISLRKVSRFGLELGWDLLMERINGIDLSDKALLHSMTIADKLKVCMQICRAIGGMHKRKLVHLDIKPSNFMLERGGRVRLIDFGISVPAGYRGKTIAGTAGFFAPEQICRECLNEDTDVFELGVTFNIIFGGEMLSQNAAEVLKKSAKAEAMKALNTCNMPAINDVPELAKYPEIANVIRACTIYRRASRINSCIVLAAKLRSAANKAGFDI